MGPFPACVGVEAVGVGVAVRGIIACADAGFAVSKITNGGWDVSTGGSAGSPCRMRLILSRISCIGSGGGVGGVLAGDSPIVAPVGGGVLGMMTGTGTRGTGMNVRGGGALLALAAAGLFFLAHIARVCCGVIGPEFARWRSSMWRACGSCFVLHLFFVFMASVATGAISAPSSPPVVFVRPYSRPTRDSRWHRAARRRRPAAGHRS